MNASTIKYKLICNGTEVQTGLDLAEAVAKRKQIKAEIPNALVTLMLDKTAPITTATAEAGNE